MAVSAARTLEMPSETHTGPSTSTSRPSLSIHGRQEREAAGGVAARLAAAATDAASSSRDSWLCRNASDGRRIYRYRRQQEAMLLMLRLSGDLANASAAAAGVHCTLLIVV